MISSCSFSVQKVTEVYKQRLEYPLPLTEANSGGHARGQLFYKNPQYVLKIVSPLPNVQAAVRISYDGPNNSYNAVILTQPGNNQRVLHLPPEIADAIQYKPRFACVETMLQCNQFYTVIFSNYTPTMLGKYKAVFECDKQMTISEIKPEGFGLEQTKINGAWSSSTCGGPLGGQYYFYNPMFAFRLENESEFQARIRVTEEEKVPGQKDTDPSTFTYAANLSVFRINAPYPPVGIVFSPSFVPCLSTNSGTYTNIPGILVTERKKLQPGTYMIVASTDQMMQPGRFEITAYYSKVSGFNFQRYTP